MSVRKEDQGGRYRLDITELRPARLKNPESTQLDTVITKIDGLIGVHGIVDESSIYIEKEDRFRCVPRPSVTEDNIRRYWSGDEQQQIQFDTIAPHIMPESRYSYFTVLPSEGVKEFLGDFKSRYSHSSLHRFKSFDPDASMNAVLEASPGLLKIAGYFEPSQDVIDDIVYASDPERLRKALDRLQLGISVRGELVSMVQDMYYKFEDKLPEESKESYTRRFDEQILPELDKIHFYRNIQYINAKNYIAMLGKDLPQNLTEAQREQYDQKVTDIEKYLAEGLDFYGFGLEEDVEDLQEAVKPKAGDTSGEVYIKQHHRSRFVFPEKYVKAAAGIATAGYIATQLPIMNQGHVHAVSVTHQRSAEAVQQSVRLMVTSSMIRDALVVPESIAPMPLDTTEEILVAQYGSTLYPSVEAMPEGMQRYFASTLQEVGDFFDVRPGDIAAIMQAENNNAGLKIHQPARSTVGARGVAQVVARTWNGWANPESHDEHTTNMLDIVEFGGIGFDWSPEARQAWRAYQNEARDENTLRALHNANANPDRFDNSAAAIARHLENWGLTREKAESDPAWFAVRLADAISVYNSGHVLSEAEHWVQSPQNNMTVGQYVRNAITNSAILGGQIERYAHNGNRVMQQESSESQNSIQAVAMKFGDIIDASYGVRLTDQQIVSYLDNDRNLLERVINGTETVDNAAIQYAHVVTVYWMQQGQEARRNGQEPPAPYIHDSWSLYVQTESVRILGHTLPREILDEILVRHPEDAKAMEDEIWKMGEARLVDGARDYFQRIVGRPPRHLELNELLQPLLAGHNPITMDLVAIYEVLDAFELKLHEDNTVEVETDPMFDSTPLIPMPEVNQEFGKPINYQIGGRHTGIDVSNPKGPDGKEPPMYAVDDGVVVHVGPLYAVGQMVGRGNKVIIIELDPKEYGPHVYAVWNHGSEANVQEGQNVAGGDPIGRQGNEGYSFGSHLHFELHVGAPFTGDWQRPFDGGQFVDPMAYMPDQ